jgi:outer membrane protein
MNKTSSFVVGACVAASLGFGVLSQAKAELKIGTIDMAKVMAGYYKTQEAQAKLEEAQRSAQDELNQRMDTYKKNLDTINKLNEELNKPDLSGASKDQKAQERDSKIAETNGLEREIQDFRSTRQKQLQDEKTHMISALVEEIMKVVTDQVKAQNFDLVFDKSGQSAALGTPVLLFARSDIDFSDAVIAKLNANRPAAAPSSSKPDTKAGASNTPAVNTKPGGFPSPNRKP